MKLTAICVILPLSLLVGSGYHSASAQDRDHGYQQDDQRNDRRHFTDHDRQVLRDWYRDHAGEFEPGRGQERWNNSDIERDLQVGSVFDEHMRHWARPVSDDLASRLDPVPPGWRFMMIGYNVCIVDRDWTIRDVYHFDQFSEEDRRVVEDWNRDHPDAMRQFLGGFGVHINDADLDRRLQVGSVVDPDLQNRAKPAPDELASRLTPAPRDWHYVIIGDRLCLVDRDWRIHESFHFQH